MQKLILFILLFNCAYQLKSQVVTSLTDEKSLDLLLNIKKMVNKTPSINIRDLSDSELLNLERSDEENEKKNVPYRFAQLIEVELTPKNSGVWNSLDDQLVWTLQLNANKAQSLSLTFQNLKLSEDAEIFIYSDKKDVIYGPLTNKSFSSTEEISTEVIEGNSITILFRTSQHSLKENNIHISYVGYGYRNGGAAFTSRDILEKSALACNVDVTDSRSDCYKMEQRAVAVTLYNNSTAYCTATLINSTNFNNDLPAYLLTAEHCSFVGGNPVFANLGVRFLYYNSGSYVTFIGTSQRAQTGTSTDASLLEMNQRPSAEHRLFFMGWDRATSPPNASRVLHHPQGAFMKISGDVDASITNTEPVVRPLDLQPQTAWRFNSGNNIAGGDFGVIEGGSSGSALINPSHRIVGQLSGGLAQSCNGSNGSSVDKWFGRFDVSYNSGTTPATRLRDWLDPISSNVQNLNASYKLFSGSTIIPCVNLRQDVSAINLQTTAGLPYAYTWRSSNNLTISGSGSAVQVRANGSCVGCSTWVECDISLPSTCGSQLIATSVRRNYSWGLSSDAKLKQTINPATNNNGSILNSYNVICANGTYSISTSLASLPLSSFYQLQWSSTGPITLYPGTSGCSFTANSSGFATITCSVVNGEGCLTGVSESYTLDIRTSCSAGFSNTGSLLKAQLEASLISQNFIEVFPNPSKIWATIKLAKDFDFLSGQIKVFNQSGVLIKSFKPKSLLENLDISQLTNGVYFVCAQDQHFSKTQKLVVSKL
ncbi:T9SS type A sorting domain-containing protein [Haliscomenobacter sp.]|uniref:T9SS type A sorting domain-containing protein n=1 Tax=Haliscomenobacter sp. TaxID=2717303 RepID=UPI003BAD9366